MSTTAAPPEKRKRLFFKEDLNKEDLNKEDQNKEDLNKEDLNKDDLNKEDLNEVSRVIPNEGVSLENDCLSSSQVSVTSVVEFADVDKQGVYFC